MFCMNVGWLEIWRGNLGSVHQLLCWVTHLLWVTLILSNFISRVSDIFF